MYLNKLNILILPNVCIEWKRKECILILEIHHKIQQNVDIVDNITGKTGSRRPMLPAATVDNHNKRPSTAINRFPSGACRHSGTEPLGRQRECDNNPK